MPPLRRIQLGVIVSGEGGLSCIGGVGSTRGTTFGAVAVVEELAFLGRELLAPPAGGEAGRGWACTTTSTIGGGGGVGSGSGSGSGSGGGQEQDGPDTRPHLSDGGGPDVHVAVETSSTPGAGPGTSRVWPQAM